MKKIFIICFLFFSIKGQSSIILEEFGAQQFSKMPLLVGLIHPDRELKKIAKVLKNDLEFTQQFEVTIQKVRSVESKDQIVQFSHEGFSLVVFLQPDEKAGGYTWRMYDTLDARMVKGKNVSTHETGRVVAHHIADELWPELTSAPGFFSTKIVYGKQVCRLVRNCKKNICIRDATDVTGESEQVLVSTPTINIVPRWNRDPHHPLILFSQYQPANIALVSVDMQGHRKIVSNFDGVNMQVAYSPEGKQVVYCLSQSPRKEFTPHITSQLYYYSVDPITHKNIFKKITHNPGNNFGPCWGPEETIFYSSDATKNGMPNICWHNLKDNSVSWLTSNSYAASPHYSQAANRLVYTKMVNKKMQLWMYDLNSKEHEQITFDNTDKDDCSWSPCGNMISYSMEEKGHARVALFNVKTKQHYFITAEGEDCSYPAWSPYYL